MTPVLVTWESMEEKLFLSVKYSGEKQKSEDIAHICIIFFAFGDTPLVKRIQPLKGLG